MKKKKGKDKLAQRIIKYEKQADNASGKIIALEGIKIEQAD